MCLWCAVGVCVCEKERKIVCVCKAGTEISGVVVRVWVPVRVGLD